MKYLKHVINQRLLELKHKSDDIKDEIIQREQRVKALHQKLERVFEEEKELNNALTKAEGAEFNENNS
jgi:hypothetical protein